MLCLSLFGFVELLGFVYFGDGVLYVAMWRVAYFSRSELNWFPFNEFTCHMAATWPALVSQCPHVRLSERLTRPVACGYARSKMRKHGAYSTGFRTTSMG